MKVIFSIIHHIKINIFRCIQSIRCILAVARGFYRKFLITTIYLQEHFIQRYFAFSHIDALFRYQFENESLAGRQFKS